MTEPRHHRETTAKRFRSLSHWARDRRRQLLENAIERYYTSVTLPERREDAQWAELAGRALVETWK